MEKFVFNKEVAELKEVHSAILSGWDFQHISPLKAQKDFFSLNNEADEVGYGFFKLENSELQFALEINTSIQNYQFSAQIQMVIFSGNQDEFSDCFTIPLKKWESFEVCGAESEAQKAAETVLFENINKYIKNELQNEAQNALNALCAALKA